MLTTAVRFIQHQLGHPARLHALLATAPALGYALDIPPSVSAASIIRWNEWRPAGWDAKPGQLYGWGVYTANTRATLSRSMPWPASANRPNLTTGPVTFVRCRCSPPPKAPRGLYRSGWLCRGPLPWPPR